MPTIDSCQLTTKDFTILEVMQERHPRGDALSVVLQRKISSAIVMFREDIPPTVVTLSTRVTYRVNDGPAETRIVAHDEMRGLVGMLLPITNPRGLALLGLAEGQSMSIPTAQGGHETLTVHEVVYQPEAARRERLELRGMQRRTRGDRTDRFCASPITLMSHNPKRKTASWRLSTTGSTTRGRRPPEASTIQNAGKAGRQAFRRALPPHRR
ncbi:nucleoside-diphosphate kinase [Mesorhizobium sp. BR1-1-6]|uniref:nucleoside-diphosphate kinase n=1 Tax=Mesorhizobium sp. BR1-1-6 TaxID=2876648 RepID=UPI001CD08020|nr:nucleoside-diphosphate kinase [Mesorhizobium sp. BR1-1-6]MBZ9898397.1 nucleoside-diphosphate kinase [Mesorhizobium sp. BR1-1-6]